jgi:dTDP-4-dehydrorhamnose 3,5-epimerase
MGSPDYPKKHGIDIIFVQDNHAFSAEKGTVRGLHSQAPPLA